VRGLWVGAFDDWAKTWLSNRVFTTEYSMTKPDVADTDAYAFTFFPPDTMAALLERSLFYAPKITRLDDLLDRRAGNLTQKLEENIENAYARRRARLDELRRSNEAEGH
jgi:hypothetical protein